MGGNQGAIFQQGEPLSNYDVLQKVPEHNLSYLKHKTTHKEYMIREFAINDKTEFALTCQKIKNRKKLESNYLTKLQRYSQQLEDNMCSSFYKIFAMWEYPTHTLADEVNERALQKRHFQENELFSIIASVIEGMSCLQSSGVKHECLSVSTILFDETGIVKVADPLTSIAPSNFDRINTNRKAKAVYISPQQCESLKNQRPIPNRNPYKSDVFILGVIMLECGLLEGMDGIFVDNFEDVDLEGLNEKLEQFGKVYSKDLKLTVSTMLTREPKERMDWIGLKQYVPQKNDHETKQNNNSSSSFGYKAQTTPQTLPQQQPSKITLGGGVKAPTSQLSFNPLPKFHTQIPKLHTQTHFNYPSSIVQPPFNPQIPQSGQSYGYQPSGNLTSTSFTTSTANYVPPTAGYGFSGLNSNLYGGQTKVSNYIIENKPSYQRQTEEYLAGNISKANSGVPTTLIDRESSSFPLNSQLQFKRDYIAGGNANYNPPTYDSQSSANHFANGKNPLYTHHFNQFSAYSGLNPSVTYTNELKSFTHNEKTQIASNPSSNSPLLSQHVKDAKSVTYDKNLYSSYITEEKSSYLPIQDGGYNASHYSTIVQPGTRDAVGNGYSSTGYYQPIHKPTMQLAQEQLIETKNLPHYIQTTTPVLYQPLSTVSAKEKPNLTAQNQPPTSYQSDSQKSVHTNVFTNTATIVTPKSTQQAFHNKQINAENQPSSSSRVSQSTAQQQLEYVIEHFKQGSRYEGTKYQDMRHGQGKFFYQDGGMYEGNWKFNKMDGLGKLYYQSGKIAYEGNWHEDQFQGYGKLYNEECDQLQEAFDYGNFDLIDEYWVYYEGNFVADEKDGEGKMVFSNGEFFAGNFHKDMLDGPGEFHRINGEIVRGIWSQNQLVEVEE